MAPKKTLSNWLTNRYLLIIRNEENFAEKKTISFNYARVILILTVAFTITLLVSVYMVTVVLEQWLDPRYAMMQSNRQLVDLTMKIDSMEYEMAVKDQYLKNIRMIIGGDVDVLQAMGEDPESNAMNSGELGFQESIPPIDSQFRAEFEQQDLGVLTYETSSSEEFRELFLFTPMEGIITDGFNPKKDHYGVDIVAKENEPVKCAADGVVIFSSWTLDSGYVIGIQHRGNLISVYKHNSELLKNVGNFVSGGEIIAIIGNTGELTSGPHLHFELWHNGNPVNPQEYVAF
ncbi:MAG: M23 family metallopeptidase [Marinoscillum sp.]|uniref:M23 family metallopeptidase n=1 Tax=Marinoscillum sp. TaxID=2024838 RepID=UPI0032FFB4DC